MDTAHSEAEPQANRWDYGVGIESNSRSGEIAVWIEPHSAASTREVEVVLTKLAWLRDKLAKYHQLRLLTQAAESLGAQPFVWLASDGEISIVRTSRQFRALAQAGLRMPVRQLRLP